MPISVDKTRDNSKGDDNLQYEINYGSLSDDAAQVVVDYCEDLVTAQVADNATEGGRNVFNVLLTVDPVYDAISNDLGLGPDDRLHFTCANALRELAD